jgi:hypothetical protein
MNMLLSPATDADIASPTLIPSRFVAKAIRAPCLSASCARWARTPENIVEGVYAAFRQPKIRRLRFSHAPIGKDCADLSLC